MYLINVNLHYFCYNYQGVYTWPNIKGAYILLQYRNERNTIMEVEFLIARFLDLTSISALWVYYFFLLLTAKIKSGLFFYLRYDEAMPWLSFLHRGSIHVSAISLHGLMAEYGPFLRPLKARHKRNHTGRVHSWQRWERLSQWKELLIQTRRIFS